MRGFEHLQLLVFPSVRRAPSKDVVNSVTLTLPLWSTVTAYTHKTIVTAFNFLIACLSNLLTHTHLCQSLLKAGVVLRLHPQLLNALHKTIHPHKSTGQYMYICILARHVVNMIQTC